MKAMIPAMAVAMVLAWPAMGTVHAKRFTKEVCQRISNLAAEYVLAQERLNLRAKMAFAKLEELPPGSKQKSDALDEIGQFIIEEGKAAKMAADMATVYATFCRFPPPSE